MTKTTPEQNKAIVIEADPMDQPFPIIAIKDLSMAGHDFAAALMNDSVWGKINTKFSVSELASLPLRIIEKIASEFLMKWAISQAGLD